MKRTIISFVLGCGLLVSVPLHANDAAKFNGKWRLVEYRQYDRRVQLPKNTSGHYRFDAATRNWSVLLKTTRGTRKNSGTFSVNGAVLTVKTGKLVQKLRFAFTAKGLLLRAAFRRAVLLVRMSAKKPAVDKPAPPSTQPTNKPDTKLEKSTQ